MAPRDFHLRGFDPSARALLIASAEGSPLQVSNDQPETRVWVLHSPKAEADAFLTRFTSKQRGWQPNGTGASSEYIGKTGYHGTSVLYMNEETGDQLAYQTVTYLPSNKVERSIHLSPSPSFNQPWPKIKRWFHLLFRS